MLERKFAPNVPIAATAAPAISNEIRAFRNELLWFVDPDVDVGNALASVGAESGKAWPSDRLWQPP